MVKFCCPRLFGGQRVEGRIHFNAEHGAGLAAKRLVKPPVPLPTSSTRSSRLNSAVRTRRSSRFRSMRKFWPSLLLGLMPRSSKRLRSRRRFVAHRDGGFAPEAAPDHANAAF